MSMFQKRHYVEVAKVLKNVRQSLLVTVTPDTTTVWNQTVGHFISMFHADSPRFDVQRFHDACMEN